MGKIIVNEYFFRFDKELCIRSSFSIYTNRTYKHISNNNYHNNSSENGEKKCGYGLTLKNYWKNRKSILWKMVVTAVNGLMSAKILDLGKNFNKKCVVWYIF